MITDITPHRCYVIAEIGACHQGDLTIAKQMIDVAAVAKVDAVKGQKRCLVPGVLFDESELAKPYVGPHSFGETYGEHRAALEFTVEQHAELATHARGHGLDYGMSTWDPVSTTAVEGAVDWYKVPSACAKWTTYLEQLAAVPEPIILSTGMCQERDVLAALNTLADGGHTGARYVLQCVTSYPSSFDDLDLSVIPRWIADPAIDVAGVGLSGHHRGIAVDVGAVAIGACIVERHFTLDRTQKGTDHAAALEPGGLISLVRDIRAWERAKGSDEKVVHECEIAPMGKLRTKAMGK